MPNWYESVEAAAEELARTEAAARRSGGLVKRAWNPMEWYGQQDAGTQQLIRNGLGGAAIGGLGGAALGYRDRDKRNPLTTALTGALAGGAVGAGGTMAWNAFNAPQGGPDASALAAQNQAARSQRIAASGEAGKAFGENLGQGKMPEGPESIPSAFRFLHGAAEGVGSQFPGAGKAINDVADWAGGPGGPGRGGVLANSLGLAGGARGAWKSLNQVADNRARQFMAGVGETLKSHKFPAAGAAGSQRLQDIRDLMQPEHNRMLPSATEVLRHPGLRSNVLQQQQGDLAAAIRHLQGGDATSPGAADAISRAMTPVTQRAIGQAPTSLPTMPREDLLPMLQAERGGIEAAINAGKSSVPSLTRGQIFRNFGRNMGLNAAGGYLLGRGAESLGGWLGDRMPIQPSSEFSGAP